MSINDRWARALLSHLTEPGDLEVGRLVLDHGPVTALDMIRTGLDVSATLRSRLMPRWPREVDPAMSNLENWYVATVTRRPSVATDHLMAFVVPGDPDWPGRLNDLGPAAPFGLWVRSALGANAALRVLNTRPAVALVGARAATSYGEHVTMELAVDLVTQGVVTVSGAAYGSDGAAQRATLQAGGSTIAFLPGGVDRPYPMGHADLIERIGRTGAVVSEVPPGSSPTRWRFLQRNRLIAAASDATVVVEAGFRSGSLNTAGHAQSLDRPLGAVPGPITSAASTGCHRIIREMDGVCITSAKDVMQMLPQVLQDLGAQVNGRLDRLADAIEEGKR